MLGLMAGHFMLVAVGSDTVFNRESPRQRGGALDSTGGPDASLYYWVDNQGADTANYNWIELAGTGGTQITAWTAGTPDDGYFTAPLSFIFPFYFASYSSLNIGTNGHIQLTTTTTTPYVRALPIPTLGAVIIPQAEDLNTAGAGINGVWYRDFGTYFVVEWDSVIHFGQPASVKKFEVILFADGRIKFQYAVTNYYGAAMLAGIQGDGFGSNHLQYYFSALSEQTANRPAAGRAIWFFSRIGTYDFRADSLLSPAPQSVFGPGMTVPVGIRIRNTGLTDASGIVTYEFNHELTVVEIVHSLSFGESEDHIFATPVTAPVPNGVYPLKIWVTVPWDANPANDTISTTVNVLAGAVCSTAIPISGTGGPQIFSNCNPGTNPPGQPCGESNNEIVFKMDVPHGHRASIWQSANTFNSRHTLRWGGICPGINLVACIDDPDTARLVWSNSTGSIQTLYLTIGNRDSSGLCGDISLMWSQTISVPIMVPPDFTENFDALSDLTDEWTVQDLDGTTAHWSLSTGFSRTFPNAAYIGGVSTGNNDWLFSPALGLSGGVPYILDYFRRSGVSNVSDHMEVRYGTAPEAVSMTYTLLPLDTCRSTAYRMKWGQFTPPAAGHYYIGFHSLNQGSSARTFLEDIKVYSAMTSCTPPDSVRVLPVSGIDQVTLLATRYGGSGLNIGYQWYQGVGTQNSDSMIIGANGPSLDITESGNYSCKVGWLNGAACAVWDSARATVAHCAGEFTIPYAEGFEGAMVPLLPICWSQHRIYPYPPDWVTANATARGGTKSVRIGSSGSNFDNWLFSPALELSAGQIYHLDYYYRALLNYEDEHLEVKIGSAPDVASMTTTLSPNFAFYYTPWVLDTRSFTPSISGNYYIGWHAVGGWQSGIALDDIVVYPDGACSVPDSVRVPAMRSTTQVTLSASIHGGYGRPWGYQWYHGIGVNNPDSLIAGATDSTYVTTVRGIYSCKGFNINSTICAAWDSALADIVDCASDQSFPVIEGFEGTVGSDLPPCWTSQIGGEYGQPWSRCWRIPRTGLDHACVGWDDYHSLNSWLFSRAIQLVAGQTYILDYYYRAWYADPAMGIYVKVGMGAQIDSMRTSLAPYISISNTTYAHDIRLFTPVVSGLYYFGWLATSYSDWNEIFIDDIAVYPQSFCTPPDRVLVQPAKAYERVTLRAVITGGYGYPSGYQWYHGLGGSNPDSLIPGATDSTLQTTVSGVYSCKGYRVGAELCAAWDSAYAQVLHCPSPIALPVFEDFEDTTVTNLPRCWSEQDAEGDGVLWEISADLPHAGSHSVVCNPGPDGISDDWLFLPQTALAAGQEYVFEFWYRQRDSRPANSLEVMYGTEPSAATMRDTVCPSFTFSQLTSHTLRYSTFTPDSSGNYYIGIHAISSNGQGAAIIIDDVGLYSLGYCTPPESVQVPAVVRDQQVVLTASVYGGNGHPVGYQWYHGIGTAYPDSLIPGATFPTCTTTVSGVFTCKGYNVNAVTCAAWDSARARVLRCDLPVSWPYIEGFEGLAGTALPDCWTVEGTRSWQRSATYPHRGTTSIYMPWAEDFVANGYAFPPPMALTAGQSYIVEFWYKQPYTCSPGCTVYLEVKYGTSPSWAAMTGVVSDTFGVTSTTYTFRSSQFTPDTSGNYYIGIHGYDSNGPGLYIDDLTVYPMGPCEPPDSIRIRTSGYNYLSLTAVVYGGSGGPLQYQWYHGTNCQISDSMISGATTNNYLTLISGTYSCKSWRANGSICFVVNSVNAVVPVDPCPPLELPFYQGFDQVTAPALPSCWRITNSDNALPVWITSQFAYVSPPNDAYISLRNPSLNDWLISPPIALVANHNYYLDYYYRANYYTEYLEVKMGTVPHGSYLATTVVPMDSFRYSTFMPKLVTFSPQTSGNYYFGWHATSANANSIHIDNIRVFEVGSCSPPDSVRVAPVVTVGHVNLTASVYGGYGSERHYQWFRGVGCLEANRIDSAQSITFGTDTSGVFSCRVWYLDSVACASCDSALATVTPWAPGDACGTALPLVAPMRGTPTVVTGSTASMNRNCTVTCGNRTSSWRDMFYSLTLNSCRRIAMSLTTGDMHLTLYEGLANCCGNALLCNDDDSLFTPLPAWDLPAQHPGNRNAYIAANLDPGTYLVRVGYSDWGAGPYTLTVYDNGPCILSCDPVADLTAYISPDNPTQVWLNFQAPDSGSYVIFSTTLRNNDGDPRGGDPQWTMEATVNTASAGPYSWNDTSATVAYKNYVVIHQCSGVVVNHE
jgi:hypothetical protein